MLGGVLEAALKAFFLAFGTAINDYLGRTRSEQAQRDLGRAETERYQAKGTLAAKEAELKAAVEAPADVTTAIEALRRGEEA